MSNDDKKIRFRDLSGALKTFTILGWIVIGLYALSFIVGFMYGLLTPLP